MTSTLLDYLNNKQLTELYNKENGGFNNVIGAIYNVILSATRSGAKSLKQGRTLAAWTDHSGKAHKFDFSGSTIDPRLELRRLVNIDQTVAGFCTITYDEEYVYLVLPINTGTA